MNPAFFQQIEAILATERLDAYRQDGVIPEVTLARYLWNMALCEALYSPLQIAELALRNSLHRCLSRRFSSNQWYDVAAAKLPSWQIQQVESARQKLQDGGKPANPGRIVAEMHFGFWTGFFNKVHAGTGIGHYVAQHAFPHATKSDRDLKKLDARWKRIRDLRNRVFHHERIVHFTDLDAQHAAMLEVVGWISPELHDLTGALDRFSVLRRAGLQPWLDEISARWPHQP